MVQREIAFSFSLPPSFLLLPCATFLRFPFRSLSLSLCVSSPSSSFCTRWDGLSSSVLPCSVGGGTYIARTSNTHSGPSFRKKPVFVVCRSCGVVDIKYMFLNMVSSGILYGIPSRIFFIRTKIFTTNTRQHYNSKHWECNHDKENCCSRALLRSSRPGPEAANNCLHVQPPSLPPPGGGRRGRVGGPFFPPLFPRLSVQHKTVRRLLHGLAGSFSSSLLLPSLVHPLQLPPFALLYEQKNMGGGGGCFLHRRQIGSAKKNTQLERKATGRGSVASQTYLIEWKVSSSRGELW